MRKNSLYTLVLLVAVLAGCTDDFNELNTDPKNLTTDQLTQSSYPAVVKSALYSPLFLPAEGVGPFQLTQSLFSDIYAGYFATTAANFDSDRFILVGGWLNGAFTYFYGTAAPQIKYAEDFARDNEFDVENAMMKVWRVWSYHRITDYWGPVPYSEFGNREALVAYDAQEDIYNDFFVTLDSAVTILKANAGGTSFLGANDLLYGGNVDQWLRFASTLRLRLAMRVKYADPELSQTEAEKAVADGLLESNDDNAQIATSPDFRNPYNTITQWGEFRMSADMESILKGYQDPRMASYAAPAAQPDPSDDPAGVEFPYEGMRNGQTKADKESTPFNTIASDMAAPYTAAGVQGPNVMIMKASESFFLRAEGALEGWNMGGGTAQQFYEEGIVTSHAEYGLDGTTLSGEPYPTSPNTPASFDGSAPPASTVPVAYDAAGDKERQLEQIITQKWISLYPDSQEAWAEKRRTGYPTFYPRLNSDVPGLIPVDVVPRRVTYVDGEFTTNAEAVQEAIDNKLGGPDNGATKLWWDKK